MFPYAGDRRGVTGSRLVEGSCLVNGKEFPRAIGVVLMERELIKMDYRWEARFRSVVMTVLGEVRQWKVCWLHAWTAKPHWCKAVWRGGTMLRCAYISSRLSTAQRVPRTQPG